MLQFSFRFGSFFISTSLTNHTVLWLDVNHLKLMENITNHRVPRYCTGVSRESAPINQF